MILHCNLEITKMHLETFAESGIVTVTGTGGTLNYVGYIPQDRGKTDSSIKKQEMWLQGRQTHILLSIRSLRFLSLWFDLQIRGNEQKCFQFYSGNSAVSTVPSFPDTLAMGVSSIPWLSLFQYWYIQGYFECFPTMVRMKKTGNLHGGAISRETS